MQQSAQDDRVQQGYHIQSNNIIWQTKEPNVGFNHIASKRKKSCNERITNQSLFVIKKRLGHFNSHNPTVEMIHRKKLNTVVILHQREIKIWKQTFFMA